jgi:hypothetical protein
VGVAEITLNASTITAAAHAHATSVRTSGDGSPVPFGIAFNAGRPALLRLPPPGDPLRAGEPGAVGCLSKNKRLVVGPPYVTNVTADIPPGGVLYTLNSVVDPVLERASCFRT